MKKIVSILLIVFCFVLPLSACGNSSQENKYRGKYYEVQAPGILSSINYIELKSNGKAFFTTPIYSNTPGTYKIEGEEIELTFNFNNERTEVYKGTIKENEITLQSNISQLVPLYITYRKKS